MVKKTIKILLVVLLLIIGAKIIQTYNLNGFNTAHFYEGKTKISRDNSQKYNGEWSYKIESTDYNDFMLYKTIKVKKNTAYKVSCMIKTKNIEFENNKMSGFNICLKDGLERSNIVYGTTNEWEKVTFYFDSKDSESIDIAFRLGTNNQNCKGTVWISNINIEVGRKKETSNWNFAVFMINNTNVRIGNSLVKEELSLFQANAMKNSFLAFKETIEDFTDYNVKVNYDIITIEEPLKSLSYDEEVGYFVSAEDSHDLINKYIYKDKVYDHIFIIANIGDSITSDEIEWLGLGGMLYDNIGYSNIRISDDSIRTYITSYANYFPEEVILHEFLHTLERNSMELGYDTIKLHDFKKYGYENESGYGLKKWYKDYITNNIRNSNFGIKEEVYFTQPVSEKNFSRRENITQLIYDNQNIIQKISEKISKIW